MMEKFAALEHERWVKWQKYMHSKFLNHSDGRGEYVCLPMDLLKRWEKQIETPYSELSEQEKESDREQVRPYLEYFSTLLDKLESKVNNISVEDEFDDGTFLIDRDAVLAIIKSLNTK